MQFIIPATFIDETGFKSGLTPSIIINKFDDKNSVFETVITDTIRRRQR